MEKRSLIPNRREAEFYEKSSWDNVTCHLCPHNCSIAPSTPGVCGVRRNRDGTLYLEEYGKISSCEVLYAENLPLFHYKPEINWLQVGGRGCTMRCPFCNTYKYSQTGGVRTSPATPEQIVEKAVESQCRGISFGVSESAPLHEFVRDIFQCAREAGIDTHLATGGMWELEALRELVPITGAVTLGLKGLSSIFLQKHLGADKSTLLNNLDMLMALGVHVEISWLVIPGASDTREDATELRAFLESTGKNPPPLLLLPYAPDFTWNQTGHAAGIEDLKRFRAEIGDYGGAVYMLHPDSLARNTRCPQCHRTLIRRGMARAVITSFPTGKPKGRCPSCGHPVPYVVD